MLFILDNKQNTVGVANNSSPYSLPYYNDFHTENLEGVNSYEFYVPSDHEDAKLIQVEGYVIVRNLDGEHLLFTIKEVQDGHDSGKRVKYVYAEETAITDFLSEVQRPATYKSATLEYVVQSLMANSTEWVLGDVPHTGSYDVEFSDYTTLLEALRNVVSQFGMEMYFTVRLSGTKIIEKRVNIVEQRGTKSEIRFDYSYDLRGVGRTEDSSQVISALVGVGKGDNGGERVTLQSVEAFVDGDFYKESGADWIGSESALQRWGKGGRHRFGVFLDEDADTPEALKRKTLKELEKRIVPDVHYSSSIANLERISGYEGKKVRLGDTVIINDKSFEPAIVIRGRVKELKRSYTRIDADEVSLGSYKPVTISPNVMLRDLQKIISKSQEQWKDSGSILEIESLNGSTFKNGSGSTTLTARVFSAGLEEDKDGSAYTYKWYKYNSAGNLITLWGGSTDYRTGKSIDVTSLDVDTQATFLVKIDNIGQRQYTIFEVFDGEKGERGLQGIQGDKGDQGIQGVAGQDGKSSYTHIAYANSADGVTGFSTSDSTNKEYIGMYVDFNATDSTNPSLYNWTLIKGQKGDQGIQGVTGQDGKTPYLHIAYANSGDGSVGFDTSNSVGKSYIGQYTDFISTDSTDYTKYSWTLIKGEKGDRGEQGLQGLQGDKGDQGIKGEAGKDGLSSYTHIAYANNSTGTSGFSTSDSTDKSYIGMYVDNIATDSTDPTLYNWTLVKGQKGDQGIQGQAGADGKTPYLHIAYATNATGTAGFSVTDSVGKTYIGQYTDFVSADSTDPAKYKWTLIKGEKGDRGEQGLQGLQGDKGDQGIQGVKGADGVSSYTHIAYADSADGSVNFSVSDSNRTYIGMYVDSVATDSTDYTKYNWSLIKGAKGDQGIQGAKGVDGKTPYFHVAYANSADGVTGFSTTDSTNKLYIGTYTDFNVNDSTSPSTYSWTLIKGDKGDKGDQGIQGVQGVRGADGTTYYTWIKYADTPTTGMSDYPDGKTYMGIAYNKTTATESSAYADYQWSLIKGTDGVNGTDGADGTTTFTWVKYADTETGSGMSDSPNGKRYLGLAYNKTTSSESTNPADYSWSPLYDNVKIGGRNLAHSDVFAGWGGGYTLENNIFTFTNQTSSGIRLDYSMFEPDTDYVLSFKMRKTSGTITNIAGHTGSTSGNTASLDGNVQTISTWSSGLTYPDDTLDHKVVLYFKANSSITDYLYIQPNRGNGYAYTYSAEIWEVQVAKGNLETDYTVPPEDIKENLSELDNRTQQQNLVDTIVASPDFESIMSDKVNSTDITDMATGEMVTGVKDEAVKYVDGRIDGDGGVNEKINAVTSELEQTANSINAKFTSSGGVNLIKNSIGYADLQMWNLTSGAISTVQNKELEQLGFGSGFYNNATVGGIMEQVVNIQPKNPDGSLRKHSLSLWLKKTVDNATNGWAGVDIFAGGQKIAFVGKGSGAGVTQGWELGLYTFETTYSEVTIKVTFGSNAEAYISGLMLNVGEDALQWQHANGEIYNTNIQMNLNGIKVINEATKGHTIMSPQEFSGYAEVFNEVTQKAETVRVFSLNGATTEVTQLDVDNEVKMKSIAMKMVETSTNKGWAFVADE